MQRAHSAGFVALCVLGACSRNLPAPMPAPVLPAPSPPPALHGDDSVVPAELGDPGAVDRLRRRVRVRHFGEVWTAATGKPVQTSPRSRAGDEDHALPVLAETRSKIRVVEDGDEARLAVWIARADTWRVIAAPVQLSDRDGRTLRDVGAWIVRGAPVDTGESVGALIAVRVHDVDLDLRGFAPANLVTHVWVAGSGDPAAALDPTTTDAWVAPPDPRPRERVWLSTKLHSAVGSKTPVIATVENEVPAIVVEKVGDFRKVEIVRPYARIRGYLSAAELSPTDALSVRGGRGRGFGFGMSHADRIDIPAGTCLFAGPDGEVIGVQLAPSTRYGHRSNERGGWSTVYVGTIWATLALAVRDTSDDPKQPRWESCTQPAHR